MPLDKVDRSNGYITSKPPHILVPLPTLAELQQQSEEIKQRVRYKLTDEVIKRRTRPTNEHAFKAQYGISVYEYEEMFFGQDGKCAICGDEEKNGKLLATDHDHKTGKVRGLLCFKCNSGIGQFKDSIPLLLAALEYLRK